MSLELTGTGTIKLEGLMKKIDRLPSALPRIAAQIGKDGVARVGLGFRRQADPYGTAWKPNWSRGGKTLMDTGWLAGSFQSKVEGTTIKIGTSRPFADVHQKGMKIVPKRAKFLRFRVRWGGVFTVKSVTIPSRKMVPSKEGGLPDTWRRGFTNIVRATMREVLRG